MVFFTFYKIMEASKKTEKNPKRNTFLQFSWRIPLMCACMFHSGWHSLTLHSILLSSWLCIAGGGTKEEKVEKKNQVMKKKETKLKQSS